MMRGMLAATDLDLGISDLTAALAPSGEAVLAALRRFHLAHSWLITHQAILWLAHGAEGEELCVASSRIDNPALQETAEQLLPTPPRFFRAAPHILKPYFAELGAEAIVRPDQDPEHLRELAEEAPVVDFVNAMLAEASARRASDVHIEPFEERLSVRFRVDGVLTLWRDAPRSMFDAVASRVKILSGMDIAERRRPQDGRQSLRIAGSDTDVRVSSLPTTWGESIVLRFLGKQTGLPTLKDLGFSDTQQAAMRGLIAGASGMILVTGPTGSGKTTTVYRLISELNDGLRKIVTVEDPVEVDLPGVMQTQARPDIGLSFATGLRAILRQDPDVILVGEIRDAETAAIATQAALTGHLVISTIHTTTALGAITRLMDLGVESYFIADVLRGLVGQRLVRRLCTHCSVASDDADFDPATPSGLSAASQKQDASWRAAVGCTHCGGSGYSGRIGAFELAAMTPSLRTAVRNGEDEQALERCARESGFLSAYEDGVHKARAGYTTLREVQRALAGATE